MQFSRVLALCSFLPYTGALAVGRVNNGVERRDTTVTEAQLSNFRLFANYTAASYCPNNENSTTGTPITCPSGDCPLAEATGAISVVEFGVDNTTAAIKGFVATDPVNLLVVVAFAGSGETIRNWITDFDFAQVSYSLCDTCTIHSGFSAAWAERRDLVVDAVTSSLAANSDYGLIVTGHSIGAAVATLAAAELRTLNYVADLYNYGSPRVGNMAFADFVTAQSPSLGVTYRITHVNDPVPQLPPEWIGYEHISPEYWLANGTGTTDVYGVNDIVVCEGVGNDGCNAGTGLVPLDGTAHDHYLGLITACQGPLEF